MTTWLPVPVGGNARWVYNSSATLFAATGGSESTSAIPRGNNHDPGGNALDPGDIAAAYFDEVPPDEMWTFDRIVLLADTTVSSVNAVLFLDSDKTNTTQAAYDPRSQVDGYFGGHIYEVLCRPYPIQVPGGNRLGVVWAKTDGTLLPGWARAEVTKYVHNHR